MNDKIEENYNKHFKWTIIRDLDGILISKFFSYNSTVIDMDEFTAYNAQELRNTFSEALERGAWITLAFKETLCSISSLIRHNVVSKDIMDPRNLDEFESNKFRLILISQKLEHPKFMLDY